MRLEVVGPPINGTARLRPRVVLGGVVVGEVGDGQQGSEELHVLDVRREAVHLVARAVPASVLRSTNVYRTAQ